MKRPFTLRGSVSKLAVLASLSVAITATASGDPRRRGRMSSRRIRRSSLALACAVAGLVALPGLAQAENAREINVSFQNESDQPLELAKWELRHGCWGAGSPPARIAVDATVSINSRSCGVLTGTEFVIEYRLADSRQLLRLHYNNPYVGVSKYTEQSPEGYQAVRSGDEGDEARVTLRFGCSVKTCDGIPDDWKRNGVTIDPEGPEGPKFIDLPKMGVELDRPNVLVHLDWMQDAANDESLNQGAIDRVIRAYDQVPVTFRGASRPGINLVVDHGPDSTIEPGGATWGSLSAAGRITWSPGFLTGWRDPGYQLKALYDRVRDRLTPAGRLPMFHYGISTGRIVAPRMNAAGVTEFDNTSGYGVSFGFIVSLGGWNGGNPTVDQQAGTFMHELGHTLGLIHGGSAEELPNEEEYKPNYPSVMNYLFQTRGLPRGGAQVWDYSRLETPDFDETTATEAGGVSLGPNGAGYGTGHRCPDGEGGLNSIHVNVLAPVDWSCDAGSGTGFDVNGDGRESVLKGSTSDWSRLRFKTGGVGGGKNPEDQIPASGETEPSDELTMEQDAKIVGPDADAPTTTLHRDPDANADGWNNGPVTLRFSASDGDGSGISRTDVAIGLGDYQPVTGPIVLADEGAHRVRYRSVDKAQNVEAERLAAVRIDLTDPATAGTLDPAPNAAGWSNGAVTVRVAATDALSGVRSVTMSSTGAVQTAAQTTTGDAAALLVDRDGITTVRHHATDRADNSGDGVQTTVKTDATPPSSTIDHRQDGATVIHRDDFVSGTAADATSGVDHVRITYTPRFSAPRETTTVLAKLTCADQGRRCTWQADRPPHPGPWQVEAVATDLAGNHEPDGPSARVVITG